MGLSDIDIKLVMNLIYAYGAQMDCKYLEVSLRDEKRSDVVSMGKGKKKPYHLRYAIEASRLLCQASVEY